MASPVWYDDPHFDDAAETIGGRRFRGDAWRRLQQLREAGVRFDTAIAVAGVSFRREAVAAAVTELLATLSNWGGSK